MTRREPEAGGEVEPKCTCNEPPYTGHFLWCEALRGRPEFRPDTKPKAKP